jgi:hypothetical protein
MKAAVKAAKDLAIKKALIVRKSLNGEWSVTLPNGVGFHALTDRLDQGVRAY